MNAAEKQAGSELRLDIREERLAQQLLDMPWEQGSQDLLAASTDLIGGYERELLGSTAIALMMDRNPVKAHQYVGHHVRKVPFAAMSALVYTQVLHNIVPLLENKEPLCSDPDLDRFSIGLTSPAGEEILTGAKAAFMRCLVGILERGWDEAQETTQNDNTHPYNVLWECYEGAQFFLGCSQRFEAKPAFRDPQAQKVFISEDNASLALELLLHLGVQYIEDCSKTDQWPSTPGVTRQALRSADRLGWSSTGNRKSIASLILAGGFEIDIDCPVKPTSKRLVVPVADTPRIYGFNHKSVAEGPWPYERLCPASMFLAMPTERDRDVLRRFYRIIHAPADEQDCPYFSRTTLLLQIASLVARETIFKNRQFDQANMPSLDDLIFQNARALTS